ncbi:MAG: DNA repair protein RecN [Ignavibacteriales bacterium]
MILELRIRDFALVDSIRMRLEPGLNVLTGETGAGKSIIIDAVEVLLGGRASSDYVRTGSEGACVEALFDISGNIPAMTCLARLGIRATGRILVSREISSTGRSVARIDGKPATAGALKELGVHLVDIHGQHEHQSLLRTETHLDVLDAFGGPVVAKMKATAGSLYSELQSVESDITNLLKGEKDRARRLDILRYQKKEIEGVAPRPGEDRALAEEALVLRNAERLKQAALAAYALLYDGRDTSAVDLIGAAASEVSAGLSMDPGLSPAVEAIVGAAESLKEAARDLRAYAERLESDQKRLAEVEARIDRIQQLKSKYGDSIEEVLEFGRECAAEIERLENSESLAASLERRREELRASLGEACAALSAARREMAPRFEALVSSELEALGVGSRAFSVDLSTEEDSAGVPVDGRHLSAGPKGVDRAEFLIAPNTGEPPKPLTRIASGGEMSRVMLAIKSVMGDAEQAPCVIFDEIDSGIGGATARAVGKRLASMGEKRQVLCVTHLAHIAARAGTHFLVWKETDGKTTHTRVEQVTGAGRETEIARMLGGSSEIALKHARELLANR